jgi:hypothetical protein
MRRVPGRVATLNNAEGFSIKLSAMAQPYLAAKAFAQKEYA